MTLYQEGLLLVSVFSPKSSNNFHLLPFQQLSQSPAEQKRLQSLPIMSKNDEPVVGIPLYDGNNAYQAGQIPSNAIFGDPQGVPIHQTMYRDTPAPFYCVYCGNSGLTAVRCLFYLLSSPTFTFFFSFLWSLSNSMSNCSVNCLFLFFSHGYPFVCF